MVLSVCCVGGKSNEQRESCPQSQKGRFDGKWYAQSAKVLMLLEAVGRRVGEEQKFGVSSSC